MIGSELNGSLRNFEIRKFICKISHCMPWENGKVVFECSKAEHHTVVLHHWNAIGYAFNSVRQLLAGDRTNMRQRLAELNRLYLSQIFIDR